ncbi:MULTISPECIES: metalloregulator ArsR/SmtB family transcription factor [Morganella]|uniref:helix-turn-helix transcriptional regulator n=1 Tax=Morganella TaxID=581 RepID=UPI000EB86398|nr:MULTISPECIES: metalloregulator ArsR/SmtB family transcription factor [Morganella]BEP19226.1 transcriptional regulator [Morganella morganii subsp. sibonii]HAE79351.1 MarR family transcriptional regulator [Morganella sp. (in: enterobacteria)]HDS6844524.1 transcriptional regulator [Morganella morganii subsp. morganii]EGT3623278.1 transcriptional regulator [Morganella morganii]EGT3631172.1 transcriptional regulator [Morganella morganii]
MSRTNLESNLSSAQSVGEKLLILLKKHGPMQASEAGEHLGTTGEAARQQFTKLARDGMVEAHSECRGVGRPVQRWHLTALGNKRFPDCHAELTVKILTTIRRELGEDAIGKIITARENEARRDYFDKLQGAETLEERIIRLVAIRTEEGYMAQWEKEPEGSWLIIENHCPICSAARMCQGFCRAELELFQTVLDANVERVEYLLTGSRRCVYRVIQQED